VPARSPRRLPRPARLGWFIALALVLAVVFVRLGFWQIDRLHQRRARNAAVLARLEKPVQPIESLRDTAAYRRATLTGAPDYDNEIILTGRSRNGSPGVYLLTPVRGARDDSAVIVVRGWVYAADAATVDATRWREARTTFTGYTAMLPSGGASASSAGRKVRSFAAEPIRRLLPYPMSARYLVSQDSGGETVPARLPPPELDDGPHLSYAIQWFSFALIALGGTAAVVYRARVSPESVTQGPASTDVDYR